MSAPGLAPASWPRTVWAVEKGRERRLRAAQALDQAGIPYAVVGGLGRGRVGSSDHPGVERRRARSGIASSVGGGTLRCMRVSKAPIIIAAVLALAAITFSTWQQVRFNRYAATQTAAKQRLEAELTQLRAEVPNRAELDRLRTAEAEAKLEIARLRAALTGARRPTTATPAPPVAVPGTGGTEPASSDPGGLAGGMKDFMRGAIEQQYAGQLARMKEKLKLTPLQEEAIRAIHLRQIEQAAGAAARMFGGQMNREEMEKLQSAAGNPEQEIRALLDAEQLARYDEYQQEEARGNARLVANAELLQMQGTLGLTPEQQDRVFEALYDFTADQLSGKSPKPPGLDQAAGPAAAFDLVIEQKVAALAGVLTPAQLEQYREMQRKQMDLIKGILPTPTSAPAPDPSAAPGVTPSP